MSMENSTYATSTDRIAAFLGYLFALGVMVGLGAILTTAMVLQYGFGELPCPLCLLQRVAMLGVVVALLMQFRTGFSYQNTGIAMLFALMLLVVAERQTLLDIYPRPGHEYVGTAILGLHMPVWGIVIGLGLLLAFILRLAVLGGPRQAAAFPAETFPLLRRLGLIVGALVTVIALVNFGSVAVQCGIGECHTEGYALLGYTPPAS